jgi:ABC-type cobalt transport system, ATPase component
MIQIENVLFQYSNSEKGTLKNINLHIAKGEFVVLLGRSGCGKTTITRLINRLVPEFFDGEMKGKVIIDGEDTSELNIQDLTGVVGSVFQDSRSQFFATDTTAEIAFSCENVGLPREELCRRIEKTVNYLQIEHLLERSIFELSSGEKQSIAIASVYALSPKILLLDEPSANLDTVATKHLMDILYMLKKQGYTIVVSEHRIHYLKDIADRAILIENGCITKEISGDKFRNLTNEEANQMGLRSTNITKILPCYKEIEQADKQLHWNKVFLLIKG